MSPVRVYACLIETGDLNEAERLARIRAEHPGARVISVGETGTPESYDAGCQIPVPSGDLAQLLQQQGGAREIA